MIEYIFSIYYNAKYQFQRLLKKPANIERAHYTYPDSCAWEEHNYLVTKINEIIDKING